jgi:hypothetical protein
MTKLPSRVPPTAPPIEAPTTVPVDLGQLDAIVIPVDIVQVLARDNVVAAAVLDGWFVMANDSRLNVK